MTRGAAITVTLTRGRPALAGAAPGIEAVAGISADGRLLRVALRGRGDVELRFAAPVRDIDVRGGFALALPGDPYVVRAAVRGRLSVTAALRR